MRRWLDQIVARLAWMHADRVYQTFLRAIRNPKPVEARSLRTTLEQVRGSEFARQYDLHSVRSRDDLRKALPIFTYEEIRPYIDREALGQRGTLLNPHIPIEMFATSSGTTDRRKLIPVTPAFVSDYRRGWNTFGLKLLRDHREAFLRDILQISSRMDEDQTPTGIPCGAITGLLARTQKKIVRRYYVGCSDIALLDEPGARYYTLMRLGAQRDVSFAVTANPATLIRLAQTANEQVEHLIRDIHEGTISDALVSNAAVRERLSAKLKKDPQRARELENLVQTHGRLRPADMWKLSVVVCWQGGSLSHYVDRVRDWWGEIPIRDPGLIASEGRVSLPLGNDTAAGPIDPSAGVFEFIPLADADKPQPATLWPDEVVVGEKYVIVLSNPSGLLRYRLDDVVQVTGWEGRVPMVEFLHRAGRVASVAGEKLTENQVVSAVRMACENLGRPAFEFIAAPVWGDPPQYRISAVAQTDSELAGAIDSALCAQNDEYASRRKSARLGPLLLRPIPADVVHQLDNKLVIHRGIRAEQYKRPTLLTDLNSDEELLEPSTHRLNS
jgi:hypothetical protein